MVTILYFAWVRELVGIDAERLEPPATNTTLGELADWLAERSEHHRAALSDRGNLRAAVDQRFASWDTALAGAKEIAFFPPVTGG
ncbi:molybdopterin converting factor subunit 1 [Sphingomonas sp. ID1715]|uniref:molybdopterin converting factor subunit 1 n=1 Tax=Sphingomonas sp. ID1715 TaxID=1656898 RepID=UPI001487A6B2|nr:molybdopterin converting factor subunit 1 [Sphingomonas sp. ID1715]NNM76729.1 molybdopterin converting factor subunit 1 [Sphingomonas sp. ID1715]